MLTFLEIGPFAFPMYSIMTVAGMSVALIFVMLRNFKTGIPWKQYFLFITFSVIGVVVGSRALFVITMMPDIVIDFSINKLLYNIIGGGFVFYGGLLGAVLAEKIYVKAAHIDHNKIFNLFVPAFPLFHAFGRIGCFFSGCCYGIESKWGFEMMTSPGITRFPVQLAESLFDMFIFTALLIVEKKKGKHIELLPIYMVSYSACRFLLEFLRGDEVRGHFLCFSTSQWIALGILAYYGIKAIFHSVAKARVS